MIEKVSDGVIKKGAESGEYKVTSWGQNSKSQMKYENFMGALGTISKDVSLSSHEGVSVSLNLCQSRY